jgi:two-component system sensor kinase FixL
LLARRKDGSQLPVELALNPLRIGNELHLLASITDISERVRLEQEAAVHRNELAHLSRVSMLAELSGSLAHELNQPLTAILSNAQAALRFLAKEPPDLCEVRESLVSVVDSDRRAGEVIRRLRAMLRQDPPDYQPLDANELVLDVLRIVQGDLVERNTKAKLSLAPGLPAVMGDRIQLQQVLLNLVMNGCDAMATLDASDRILLLQTRSAGDEHVEIAVVDAGAGIPPGDLERIFSPFYTTKRDGMGLGLAVCRTIMSSHGGQLSAANGEGRGAKVWIRLRGISHNLLDSPQS